MADHNNGSELEDKTSGSPEPESSEKASRGVSCEYCSIVFPKTSNYYMVIKYLIFNFDLN